MTKRETVRALCKQMITRLENDKQIVFAPRIRQEVWEELYKVLETQILSDEDLKEKAIAKLHGNSEALSESDTTDSDQFKSALKIVKSQLGENELNGLYYQKPIRSIADEVTRFLMNCPKIEDVFETDDVIRQSVVDLVQRFNPRELH